MAVKPVDQSMLDRLEADRTEFTIIKQLDNSLCLVRRKADGETLLGQRYDITRGQAKELLFELFERGAGQAAEQVLNHENLIAPQGYLSYFPVTGTGPGARQDEIQNLMLWDFCDAGTLANLFDVPPCSATLEGFLPESLVWHVAISVLRALQWLHEGIRDEYDAEADPHSADPRRVVPIRRKTLPEKDWFPVLHGAVKPENIHLSHPRGIETYGFVKLGNFAHSHVCAKILANDNDSPLICHKGNNMPLHEIKALREKAGHASKNMQDNQASDGLYTHADELGSLGAILYRMMTRRVLPRSFSNVRTDAWSAEAERNAQSSQGGPKTVWPWKELQQRTQYSSGLQETVMGLIKLGVRAGRTPGSQLKGSGKKLKDAVDPDSWENRASVVLDEAWKRHLEWRTQTEDGLGFLDVFDDKEHRRRQAKLAKTLAGARGVAGGRGNRV